ncbi:hypothetical protein [Actinomadura terrae]|uniref:hypothetical protein n=1 Tax=Actinomadura terrae TaxID=604353 RepID=UPI001FA75B85|nr:hypothetical protein [Actinomadura terrae]
MKLATRIATTTTVAALGLGLAPAVAQAAPATTATTAIVQPVVADGCGARKEDWVGVYKGKVRGPKGSKEVTVDVKANYELNLFVDNTRIDLRYEFKNGTLHAARPGIDVTLSEPHCKVGSTVTEATLTIRRGSPPPVSGHVVRQSR